MPRGCPRRRAGVACDERRTDADARGFLLCRRLPGFPEQARLAAGAPAVAGDVFFVTRETLAVDLPGGGAWTLRPLALDDRAAAMVS